MRQNVTALDRTRPFSALSNVLIDLCFGEEPEVETFST
jgi:hypothetical protein